MIIQVREIIEESPLQEDSDRIVGQVLGTPGTADESHVIKSAVDCLLARFA